MNSFNHLFRYILTSIVTSLMFAVVLKMILPKGLGLQEIPRFMEVVRHRQQNLDAFKLLEILENQDQMTAILNEMHAPPATTQIAATEQATPAQTGMVIDPNELAKIDKMNISNEMKAELRRGYMAVGSLPTAALPAASVNRAPASVTQASNTQPVVPTADAQKQSTAPLVTSEPKRSYHEVLLAIKNEISFRDQKPQN